MVFNKASSLIGYTMPLLPIIDMPPFIPMFSLKVFLPTSSPSGAYINTSYPLGLTCLTSFSIICLGTGLMAA